MIDLETGDRVEHALEFMPEVYGMDWFPDGSALALSVVTIEREREAFRIDTETGQATQLLEHGGPVVIDPAAKSRLHQRSTTPFDWSNDYGCLSNITHGKIPRDTTILNDMFLVSFHVTPD